nr:hypothetical protein [Actinoplanes derwentensis]
MDDGLTGLGDTSLNGPRARRRELPDHGGRR